MTPFNIVNMAKLKGLDFIAICDHNTCLNIPAAMKIASELEIIVIPAIELETAEEVHCLCYFKDYETCLDFSNFIALDMMKIPINKKIYGEQIVYDEKDQRLLEIDYLLSVATSITIEEASKKVHSLGGIFVPAHFDKSSFSVSSNLGFLPEGVICEGIEIFSKDNLEKIYWLNKGIEKLPTFYNSDAHFLHLINEKENSITLKEKTIDAFFDVLR
jgi:PHP family Zn ribbon phosphoesterase